MIGIRDIPEAGMLSGCPFFRQVDCFLVEGYHPPACIRTQSSEHRQNK